MPFHLFCTLSIYLTLLISIISLCSTYFLTHLCASSHLFLFLVLFFGKHVPADTFRCSYVIFWEDQLHDLAGHYQSSFEGLYLWDYIDKEGPTLYGGIIHECRGCMWRLDHHLISIIPALYPLAHLAIWDSPLGDLCLDRVGAYGGILHVFHTRDFFLW